MLMNLLRPKLVQRASARMTQSLRGFSTSSYTTLHIPNAPANSSEIIGGKHMPPKYSLGNAKFFTIFIACNIGVYAGHYFYLNILMTKNPPNPDRDPNEPRPEKHMHTVDED
mmetsp:Transcript_51570/g.120723  ORF Transcript_51570/g.120723 Transcript_51570/m.120723 type:complete len:112 (+) Transcript_51570:117-452(+)